MRLMGVPVDEKPGWLFKLVTKSAASTRIATRLSSSIGNHAPEVAAVLLAAMKTPWTTKKPGYAERSLRSFALKWATGNLPTLSRIARWYPARTPLATCLQSALATTMRTTLTTIGSAALHRPFNSKRR
jgi:hypothetical protein